MEGEDIAPEEVSEDAGWIINSERNSTTKARLPYGGNAVSPNVGLGPANGRVSTNSPASVKKSIIRRAKMPPLPKNDIKIIVRIRGGLNIAKIGAAVVADAITAAACIDDVKREADTICPNFQQNIVVVSTPEEENATKYVRIKDLCIAGHMHEAAAYRAAPHETCKGIIKNVPLSEGPEALHRKIVNPRNPLALAAKRIKESGTIIIAFEGYKVPNYVRFGNALVRCTLYRKQIDVCYACGKLGHRADVCPSPEEAVCRGCGSPNPGEAHRCTPKCELCGGEHITAGKECKQRFRTPYVVRRRRSERAMADTKAEEEEKGGFRYDENQFPTLGKTPGAGQGQERGRRRSRSRLRGPGIASRSRSGGRTGSRSASKVRFGLDGQLGTGTVRGPKGTEGPGVRKSGVLQGIQGKGPGGVASGTAWVERESARMEFPSLVRPEHGKNEERFKRLEQENAELREMVRMLRAEISALKGAAVPAPADREVLEPVESMDVADVGEAGGSRPSKRKAMTHEAEPRPRKVKSEVKEMMSGVMDSIKQVNDGLAQLNARLTESLASIDGSFTEMRCRIEELENRSNLSASHAPRSRSQSPGSPKGRSKVQQGSSQQQLQHGAAK